MKKTTILFALVMMLMILPLPMSTVIDGSPHPEHTNLGASEGLLKQVGAIQPVGMGTLPMECTLGVNHSSVTTHSGPMLWKVLDVPTTIDSVPDGYCMTVQYYSKEDWGVSYDSVAVVYYYEGIEPHKFISGGLNEVGIGGGHTWVTMEIKNADVSEQFTLLYDILGDSDSMDAIRAYLQQGVGQGMFRTSGCYGFIDSDDHASMFEVDASMDTFREYDTMAPAREDQGLLGFVVRSNVFHRTDDGMDDTEIIGRYLTGTENTLGLISAGELDERSAVQSDSHDRYRLIRNSDRPWAISHQGSLAAHAIRGAAPGEDPELATMWVLLGNPSFSIAVPTWAAVAEIPEPIRTCAMYDAVITLYNRKEIKEEWVQGVVLPAEAHLFDMVNNQILPRWRVAGPPAVSEMTRIENQMAQDAYSVVSYLATKGDRNLAPTVDFEASRLKGTTYLFTSQAADADGSVTSYLWNFGDGTTDTKISPEHIFPASGVYLVSITIADDDAVTTTAWRYIAVGLGDD